MTLPARMANRSITFRTRSPLFQSKFRLLASCITGTGRYKGSGAMSDETASRERVREAIRGGKLPHRWPDKIWGGPGQGCACAVCGEISSSKEMAFDLEFAGEGQEPAVSHHMHLSCFAVWELERNDPHISRLHRPTNGAMGCQDRDSQSETGCFNVARLQALAADGTMPQHERKDLDGGELE